MTNSVGKKKHLKVKTQENILIGENLFNYKRWFNGLKKFSSVKVAPKPLK